MIRRGSRSEAEAQCLINRVADPIFSCRQDFVIQLRKRTGDFQHQFICSWIFRAVGFEEFLPDPFFDFVVEFFVFLRAQ